MPSDAPGTTGPTPLTQEERDELRRQIDDQDVSEWYADGVIATCSWMVDANLVANAFNALPRLLDAHDALTAEDARLREALAFYADPDNWRQSTSRVTGGVCHYDMGKRAANALRDAPDAPNPAQGGRNAPQAPQNAPQGHQEADHAG